MAQEIVLRKRSRDGNKVCTTYGISEPSYRFTLETCDDIEATIKDSRGLTVTILSLNAPTAVVSKKGNYNICIEGVGIGTLYAEWTSSGSGGEDCCDELRQRDTELQNQIDNLRSRVTTLETQISNIINGSTETGCCRELENELNELRDRVTALEQGGGGGGSDCCDELRTEINNLKVRLTIIENQIGGQSKVFVATYGVTTAQELLTHVNNSNEPFAPVIIKRGNDYHTVTTAVKQSDEKVVLRTIASSNGEFYIFTYTITNGTWSSTTNGLQQKLTAGNNITIENNVISSTGGGGGGGLPSDFNIAAGQNVQVNKNGNTYTISATDTDTKTVLTAGDNVTITDSGTGGNHNYRIDVGDAGPDDYMVYSKNPNIIITAMGNDQEENIFLYDASIAGATADNNQVSDFETGTDKIEIKGTSLPKGQLTQFATQGAGIYYSNGILSYNDGTNVKTIVKVVDGSTVAAADVTII